MCTASIYVYLYTCTCVRVDVGRVLCGTIEVLLTCYVRRLKMCGKVVLKTWGYYSQWPWVKILRNPEHRGLQFYMYACIHLLCTVLLNYAFNS